jgi:hypothetical protein
MQKNTTDKTASKKRTARVGAFGHLGGAFRQRTAQIKMGGVVFGS